jgi:hypothetical protein
VARLKRKVVDNTPRYVPPPLELYIYIRKKGWLQPIPYVYKMPDLNFWKNFIKNYKKK